MINKARIIVLVVPNAIIAFSISCHHNNKDCHPEVFVIKITDIYIYGHKLISNNHKMH